MKKEQEENVNDEAEATPETEEDTSGLDFIDLVNCIVFYYTSSAELEDVDSADEWKKKAGLLNKQSIPKEVDELVKKAFMKKLGEHV